jgi:phosphatidate cytidylyltransferase
MDEGDQYEDWEDDQDPRPPTTRTPAEGVRIIGAEEAATRLESGEAAGRQPDDAPRYGDVPPAPAGPRPAHRFPLPESVDPASAVQRPPLVPPPPPPEPEPVVSPELPHWTEPATGEVPSVLASDEDDDDLNAWSGLTTRAPRWRDQESDWQEPDFDDASQLVDDDLRQGVLDPDRTEHSDLFSFDDEPALAPEPEPTRTVPRSIPAPTRRPQPVEPSYAEPSGGGPRDMQQAVVIGLGLGALALICFKLGPLTTALLVSAVILLAAVEVFDVLRRAGYKPATLLGLAATASALVATYNYGETGLLLVTALTVVTTFLWFLFGVENARPTMNVAVTLLGFMWVGFLGSYAVMLLATFPERIGIAFLLGAVLATVANDVGGLVFGRQVGTRPMAPDVSPNKTWEGVIGGAVASIVISLLILRYVPGMFPWEGGKGGAFWLGLTVAVVAPLGDLCQSMIKRDLGLKDTGTILPGHGGILDRFDAMLFVLPATYYLMRFLYF